MSGYTHSTHDIAEHIAHKICLRHACPAIETDLERLIEREMDKYFEEGTLKFADRSEP